MRHCLWILIVLFCGCSCFVPQAFSAPQSTTAARVAKKSARVMQFWAKHQQLADQICGKCRALCWGRVFPGQVNYCIGLRDWKKGHYRNGLDYLKLAAGWASKGAQYTLGLIYYNGHHVPQDQARGIAWLKLANQRHDNALTERVTKASIKLATPAQRKRARQLFKQMRKRYGDDVAGPRAWRNMRNHLKAFQAGRPRSMCIVKGKGVVTWTPDLADDPDALCMPSGDLRIVVNAAAKEYFKGLGGAVTVGPVIAVPASSASSGH